jgi:hypothetical protein
MIARHQVGQPTFSWIPFHVSKPGEINDSPRAAWCRFIGVFEAPQGEWRHVVLFPVDQAPPELAYEAVAITLVEGGVGGPFPAIEGVVAGRKPVRSFPGRFRGGS